MIEMLELARKYRLAMIPLESGGWFVGVLDRDGYPGCYFDANMGIIDGELEPNATAEMLGDAVALCVKEISGAKDA